MTTKTAPKRARTATAAYAAVEKMNDKEVLLMIRNDMTDIGIQCVDEFNAQKSFSDLRGANMAYRCAMQSIRDRNRFKL